MNFPPFLSVLNVYACKSGIDTICLNFLYNFHWFCVSERQNVENVLLINQREKINQDWAPCITKSPGKMKSMTEILLTSDILDFGSLPQNWGTWTPHRAISNKQHTLGHNIDEINKNKCMISQSKIKSQKYEGLGIFSRHIYPHFWLF